MREDEAMTDEIVPRWFVGIDWASATHQVCIIDAAGKILGEKAFAHGGAGLAELCAWLLAVTGGEPAAIAVGIEVPHGPVVETLLERGFLVHSVNPKQLDRFRDRFTVAGAKDDRRDAHVLGDALRTDGHCCRRLRLADPVVIELREWSRMADDLQQERNRLANRVREQLWRYYPQVLQLGEDVAAEWVLELWSLAPTPAMGRRLRRSSIARVLKAHRIRRLETEEVLRLLRQPPLAVAPGTTEAAVAHIHTLIPRLKLVNRQIKDAHHRLDALCATLAGDGLAGDGAETAPGHEGEQRDAAILRSLPGVGRIVLATLLAEAWEPLQARDYHALRALCGVAPVTKRSGKRCIVIMRQACHLRLRTAVYHWARTAIQHDELCRQRYAELRKRGHSHGRALRTVGDRLLAVACAMLSQNTLFDPNRRQAGQPKAA
jgi:transposase